MYCNFNIMDDIFMIENVQMIYNFGYSSVFVLIVKLQDFLIFLDRCFEG